MTLVTVEARRSRRQPKWRGRWCHPSVVGRSFSGTYGQGGIDDGGAQAKDFPLERFDANREAANDIVQVADQAILVGDPLFELDQVIVPGMAHAAQA